jgi:hypothetical protein
MAGRGMSWLFAPVIASAVVAAGCAGGSDGSPTAGSSTTATSGSRGGSHNAGRNCLSCHNFGAAGTVYRTGTSTANTAGTVRLTTAPDGGGSVVATLKTDGSGNFYTQQAVSYGSGLYADLAGASGTRASMKTAVTSGGCNACHGSSTGKLAAD